MRVQLPVRSRRFVLAGVVGLVLTSLLGLGPAAVHAESNAVDHAFAAAVSHRATVDAAVALFLSPSDPNQSQEPAAIRTESDRRLSLYRDALAEVTADRARLSQAADAIRWLSPVALGKSAEAARARRRAQSASSGLVQAEDVLSAAVDQELLGRGVFEAVLRENDMLDAMRSGQFADADRIHAQADRQLRVAETRASKPNEPPGTRLLVGSLRSMVEATDKLAIARLRDDSQDQAIAETELKHAIAEFAKYSTDRQQAANRNWNQTTFLPEIAGYDTALSES